MKINAVQSTPLFLLLGCLGFYVLFLGHTHEYSQFIFLLLFLILISILFLSIGFLCFRKKRAVNFAVCFFSISFSLLILEGLFRWNLDSLPRAVQNRYFDGDILKIQMEKLDLFDHPPYVKFKPNVCINKGIQGDLFDNWCTDARGYKNLPSVLEKPEITLAVAGDSFIEGLGVPTENTWASILNRRGLPTYSLGVQGTGVSSSVGSLKHFALDLKPSFVALGCSFCVLSDHGYRDPKTGYRYGNLVQYINAELRAQDRIRYRLAVSATVHAGLDQLAGLYPNTEKWLHFPVDWNATSFRRWVVQKIRNDPRQAPVPKQFLEEAIDIPFDVPKIIKRYENEIRIYAVRKSTKEAMISDPSWKSVAKAFLDFKKMVEEIGARPAIIYIPHRGILYYKAFVGEFPKNSIFSLDPMILKEFTANNGIDFIDLTDPLLTYIKSIGPEAPIKKYPYFITDGHLNQVGQVIVADVLEAYVQNHQ